MSSKVWSGQRTGFRSFYLRTLPNEPVSPPTGLDSVITDVSEDVYTDDGLLVLVDPPLVSNNMTNAGGDNIINAGGDNVIQG